MNVKKKKKTETTGVILVSKIPLRLTIQQRTLVDRLRKESARLWNDILDLHWWLYDQYHVWSTASEKKKWYNAKTHRLHSQTIQSIIELHEETCDRTREQRANGNLQWKYPWKYKGYFSVRYKKSAIYEVDTYLKFSNGAKEESLVIRRPEHISFDRIKSAEIVWHQNQYWLHLALEESSRQQVEGSGTAGGDLGEVHALTLSNGKHHIILTGRGLRSLHRMRNKGLSKLQKKISKKKKGSNARYKLILRKRKFLEKMERKIEYVTHCLSKMAVEWCLDHGVSYVYIGNPDGVQRNTKKKGRSRKGKIHNQRLSNWNFGELVRQIKYKGKLHGMMVEMIDESYTSGTCPSCGVFRKQTKRIFTCQCGAEGHRDAVGAINIMNKGINGKLTKGRVLPLWKDITYRRVVLHPVKKTVA